VHTQVRNKMIRRSSVAALPTCVSRMSAEFVLHSVDSAPVSFSVVDDDVSTAIIATVTSTPRAGRLAPLTRAAKSMAAPTRASDRMLSGTSGAARTTSVRSRSRRALALPDMPTSKTTQSVVNDDGKGRGAYKCRKCGEPKRNHACALAEPTDYSQTPWPEFDRVLKSISLANSEIAKSSALPVEHDANNSTPSLTRSASAPNTRRRAGVRRSTPRHSQRTAPSPSNGELPAIVRRTSSQSDAAATGARNNKRRQSVGALVPADDDIDDEDDGALYDDDDADLGIGVALPTSPTQRRALGATARTSEPSARAGVQRAKRGTRRALVSADKKRRVVTFEETLDDAVRSPRAARKSMPTTRAASDAAADSVAGDDDNESDGDGALPKLRRRLTASVSPTRRRANAVALSLMLAPPPSPPPPPPISLASLEAASVTRAGTYDPFAQPLSLFGDGARVKDEIDDDEGRELTQVSVVRALCCSKTLGALSSSC
jgi:hypothetical protein